MRSPLAGGVAKSAGVRDTIGSGAGGTRCSGPNWPRSVLPSEPGSSVRVSTGLWNVPSLNCGERCIRASRSPLGFAPSALTKLVSPMRWFHVEWRESYTRTPRSLREVVERRGDPFPSPVTMTVAKQLAGFIAKFEPAIAKIGRASRARIRKRLPTAVELVYDNYNALAMGFGPTERTSEAILSVAAYATGVTLYFTYGA